MHEESSSDDENKSSLFCLPAALMSPKAMASSTRAKMIEGERSDPGESGSKSDAALPDPTNNQLTDASEESDPVFPSTPASLILY